MKRAIIVVGVQSAGGRLWTRHVICCGAFGDGDHDQRLDTSFDGATDLIVWRRSFPHFRQFPDIKEMIDRVNAAGFGDVSAYWCQRDIEICIKSQVAAGHAPNAAEARRETELGLSLIGDFVSTTRLPTQIIRYERLTSCPRYRLEKLAAFGLVAREWLPAIRDENAKWLGSLQMFAAARRQPTTIGIKIV